MNFKMNRDTLNKLNDKDIIELFENITNFNLYSISEDWRNSDKYILKLKGTSGDVVVSWN